MESEKEKTPAYVAGDSGDANGTGCAEGPCASEVATSVRGYLERGGTNETRVAELSSGTGPEEVRRLERS